MLGFTGLAVYHGLPDFETHPDLFHIHRTNDSRAIQLF